MNDTLTAGIGYTVASYGSVRLWDNKAFGINEMEAELMDPQQRLALETSYRALEDGGFTLDDVNDSNTAVYMGTSS